MSESRVRLIFGLGNPGKEYEKTRHNLGFLVVKELARRRRAVFEKNLKMKAMVAGCTTEIGAVSLVLPLTYMNHSGTTVKAALEKFEVALSDILVVCDDLNLDFGAMRLRAKGSDGGHHGLSSIIEQVQSNDFARLRLGIGRPGNRNDVVDFVLTGFDPQERGSLEDFINRATEACEVWLEEGTGKAMDQFNKRTDHEQI